MHTVAIVTVKMGGINFIWFRLPAEVAYLNRLKFLGRLRGVLEVWYTKSTYRLALLGVWSHAARLISLPVFSQIPTMIKPSITHYNPVLFLQSLGYSLDNLRYIVVGQAEV